MIEFVRSGDPDSDIYLAGVGGDTSNAAIAAARQGAHVGYLTALGADRFAERIRRLWASEGIDASTVLCNPVAPTGLYIIDPDPIERHFIYYRSGSAASRYSEDQLPVDHLSHAAVLHVSGITLAVSDTLRRSAFSAMRQIRAAGGRVSLDTNLRLKLWDAGTAQRITHEAAKEASVLITSIEDSQTLTGLTEPTAILSHYAALGCQIVIVTRGEKGAVVQVEGETRAIDPVIANAVDSTGAGDSFAGSFLAWWLETGDPWTAARLASIVAAGTVSALGAVDPIPRREEVLQRAASIGLEV